MQNSTLNLLISTFPKIFEKQEICMYISNLPIIKHPRVFGKLIRHNEANETLKEKHENIDEREALSDSEKTTNEIK